ncbi:hypothetical protein FE257_010526 [Aspergillus nanangensis]|uniref:ZZ-type domain-containing protein n=1 Tax=Aspergillus nanangensis TaxID=2582783 RepID=A0AAD4CIF5_ASPNN|nr:hypothetical protein FE257_010526 [Aspergillus nanangensis]
MSTTNPSSLPVNPATAITLKVLYKDHTRRFKIPLKELGARILPQKLRQLLGISPDVNVIFERFSDSAGCYVLLDSENPAVYKQLYRAAKAKLKLRIRVTPSTHSDLPDLEEVPQNSGRFSYLETVLSSPLPTNTEMKNPLTSFEFPVHKNPLQASQDVVSDTTQSLADPHPFATEMRTPLKAQHKGVPTKENIPQYRCFIPGPDSLSTPVVSHTSATGVFCIDCNQCGSSIPNEHYHCSICEDGDYDLCLQCVQSGATCLNDNHWLIKRVVNNGIVTNSTTETVAPQKTSTTELEGTPYEPISSVSASQVPKLPSTTPALSTPSVERICNGCLREFDETKMVTCVDCDDYDLCTTCTLNNTHGHHPAHTFALIRDHQLPLKSLVLSRCKPGRQERHSAICDGCENRISGVRHKCLSCPDWDYCSSCHQNASQTHPGHRFVPLYGPIADPPHHHEVHYGIYCDGPLCKDRQYPSYITGARYKCSVCYDTDFCAKCEALPGNMHNRTHPLVMLKTPVRNVAVSTVQENGAGGSMVTLGDRDQHSPSPPSTITAKPKEIVQPPIEDAVKEPIPSVAEGETPIKADQTSLSDSDCVYQAFFERDTIPDGTVMSPNKVFHQTWTLRNPGPLAWPAGSYVRFSGGDSMFNVNTNHPLSLDSISAALESNQLLEPLEPGQHADFTVVLKAPSRVGTAISYWRLKLSDGTPFGHRLWCDIRVRDDVSPADTMVEQETQIKDVSSETTMTRTIQPDHDRSHMIFPKLEKESPESSTHEAANTAPVAPSVTTSSEQDVLEEVESLTLGDNDTEAGFLTDEEYDILDASDQEFMDAESARA